MTGKKGKLNKSLNIHRKRCARLTQFVERATLVLDSGHDLRALGFSAVPDSERPNRCVVPSLRLTAGLGDQNYHGNDSVRLPNLAHKSHGSVSLGLLLGHSL